MLMFRSESTLCHGQGNVKAFLSHQNSTTCRGTTLLHKWITVKKKSCRLNITPKITNISVIWCQSDVSVTSVFGHACFSLHTI